MASLRNREDILTLLAHLGCLTYSADTRETSISNVEVREEFVTAIEDSGWDAIIRALRVGRASEGNYPRR